MDDTLLKQIRAARPPKPIRQAGQSMGWVREMEPDGQGGLIPARTYFLVGSECRFSCSMCDLWKYTLTQDRTPIGSLASQIADLNRQVDALPPQARPREWLKLYNAANFFDPANVDPGEYPAILKQCEGFERLVVENHASLLSSSKTQQLVRRFRDGFDGELELALGLESIEPSAMRCLNKSMSLDQFQAALEFLRSEQIFVRVFVLLQPMGTPIDESVYWAVASCQAAARWGAQRISLIPTRAGNGFMEDLASRGLWKAPRASQLESALEQLLGHSQGSSIYMADLWDWDSICGICSHCGPSRLERLQRMNNTQRMEASEVKQHCACERVPFH
jgi:radical SAM enzyme (TIGR01210 family)